MNQEKKTKVLILGGGFAGLYTALKLDSSLSAKSNIEVTLIDRNNFFLFTPMLHEIAASDIDITHIVNPIRKLMKHVKFFEGDIEAIDLENKTVEVGHGFDHHHHTLKYDHLVIALGSITNFFMTPGLEERALTMKSLGDAIELRNRIIANLEEADTECAAAVREPLLTFIVAGGGFAGVETISSINDYLRESVRFYPNLTEDMIRIILVHPGKVILPELGEKLGLYAQEKLSKRKVEIRVNTKVSGISNEGVELSDGTKINANTLIWTAGTSANPILAKLPCNKERGRIVVNEFMEVPEHPGVWAVGDCALIPDKKGGGYYPPTAQHAIREGRVLAKNILSAIEGGRKKPFVFSTIGLLASIGRRTGVANIMGINFSGFIAWWLWRTIYLGKLPRFEKKVRVALDWTLDLFFSKDLVQFSTSRSKAVSKPEESKNEHASHDKVKEVDRAGT